MIKYTNIANFNLYSEYHLSILRHFLNVRNDFLLLLLHPLALPIQVTNSLIQSSFILSEHFLRRHPPPEQPLHLALLKSDFNLEQIIV